MYRHILNLLEEFFGGQAPYALAGGAALLVLAVVLLLMPPWRRAVRAARQRGGWRAIVLGLAHGLMMLAVGGALVAGLGGALLVQSGLFSEEHGQVTQRNYSTVQTNWGPPHEQKELQVAHTVTEEQTVLVFPDGKEIAEEEGAVESVPTGDKAPARLKRKVKKAVAQNSIVSSLVTADVELKYLKLGSAYYTGYVDAWDFDYVVRNRSEKATEAQFRFPMPAQQGSFTDFRVTVDGKDWGKELVRSDTDQTWKMPMTAGQEARIQVHYRSRGMEYVRYNPAYMARREACKVVIRLHPDPEHGPRRIVFGDLGFPVGSMSPTNRDTLVKWAPAADGEPIGLEWDLASAATTLGMGVKLPGMTQPGYYVARLLHEAPLGLALLAGAVVVSWMLLGREVDLFGLGVLAVAYYLFYTLIAYLSDPLETFAGSFVLAALAALVPAGAYLWLGWGRTFAAHQTMALFAAMVVYYPLAVVADEYTGLLHQVLYWALATYLALVAVFAAVRARRAPAPA